MAVEMVRKPSETPNIENVDDFIPLRYAYANQNGYVIGSGRIGTGIDTEAYTINGNTFTINSGRLVIQGIECDINTEHSIVIDVSSTKRYCAVYLQVNLATNTSDIFVTYDMLGTPIVDAGEDLTINSVGTARMVLFTFEVTNGIISNVVKVVRACEYSIPYKIENGVLKFKNIIIPQKKYIWEENITVTSLTEITLNEDLIDDDFFVIEYEISQQSGNIYKRKLVSYCTLTEGSGVVNVSSQGWASSSYGVSLFLPQIKWDNTKPNKLILDRAVKIDGKTIDSYFTTAYKRIYKVIE